MGQYCTSTARHGRARHFSTAIVLRGPHQNTPPMASGSQLRDCTTWVCEVRKSPIERSNAPFIDDVTT